MLVPVSEKNGERQLEAEWGTVLNTENTENTEQRRCCLLLHQRLTIEICESKFQIYLEHLLNKPKD